MRGRRLVACLVIFLAFSPDPVLAYEEVDADADADAGSDAPPPTRALPADRHRTGPDRTLFFPALPALYAPMKADPLEFRSGMRLISTSLGGPREIVTAVGFKVIGYQFPLNAAMDAQVGLVAAGYGRYDFDHDTELVAEDWRWGAVLMTRYGRWSYSLESVHHSSHLGDEFAARTGAFRIEYVNEEFGLLASYDAGSRTRLYYGGHYAMSQSHVQKPARIQAGVEYYFDERRFPGGIGPYLALDLHSRQEVDWKVTSSAVVGWAFPGGSPGRSFDLQVLALSGPSPLREFFTVSETYVGAGFAVDL
jgi:hypothetical protein